MSWYQRTGKRVSDVVVAILLLVVGAPVLAMVAMATWLSVGAPVLYRDERAGRSGTPFMALKFRTMHDGPGTDGERATRFGRVLRLTSIDELPQLINVVRGEMSLVGPRPLPVRYVERYSADQLRRLDVRPGVTGLAQVSGRNQLDWEARFRLDVAYVDAVSVRSDIAIIARTLTQVMRIGDAESSLGAGHAMPEFTGADPYSLP